MSSFGMRPEQVFERLLRAGCVAAEEEAEEFLAAAPDEATLEVWLTRRERGEPHAWIVGSVGFAGLTLHVDPGVYVPRFQSVELAYRAAALLPPGGLAFDLFTGTGAIASVMQEAVPDSSIIGVEIDLGAARCARANGISVVVGDLVAAIRPSRSADVVTAVAPYVPTGELDLLPVDVRSYEPLRALDGGEDGLDLVRRVVAAAPGLLKPGGWLVVELGGDQDQILAPVLATSGFVSVVPWRDDEGDLRGVAAQVGSGAFGHRP